MLGHVVKDEILHGVLNLSC